MALTAARDTQARTMTTRTVPLYTGVKIYQGSLVCINTAHGYGVEASVTSTLVAIGIATETVDNTNGSSGDKSVPVSSGLAYCFGNGLGGSDFTAASRGALAYTYDGGTCLVSQGSGSIAGVVEDVDSLGVWVRVGTLADSALTSASSAVSTLTVNLAKYNDATYGGTLVGVTDTAGKYAAHTVETCLAEDADARRFAVNTTGNTIGSAEICHRITVPSGSSGTVTTTLDATFGKILITGVKFIKSGSTGGASDTIKLTDGTNDLTNVFALSNSATGAVATATNITQAYSTVAAGGTLVANYTKGTTSCEGTMLVTGLRVS